MSEPVIGKDGAVTIDGRKIGRAYKGTRTHSPPLSKGSRVVKYHKQVPCWWAETVTGYRRDFRTRRAAIQWLVEDD